MRLLFGGVINNLKAEARLMIEGLREDAILKSIEYHTYVLGKAGRGISSAGSEDAISHKDAKVRVGE